MIYIKAIVNTGSKKESVILKSPEHFEVNVKDKPEKNMANKKVLELLAKYFNIPKTKIRIINGHHHPHKLLVVDGEL